jgi:hypothetical protein
VCPWCARLALFSPANTKGLSISQHQPNEIVWAASINLIRFLGENVGGDLAHNMNYLLKTIDYELFQQAMLT